MGPRKEMGSSASAEDRLGPSWVGSGAYICVSREELLWCKDGLGLLERRGEGSPRRSRSRGEDSEFGTGEEGGSWYEGSGRSGSFFGGGAGGFSHRNPRGDSRRSRPEAGREAWEEVEWSGGASEGVELKDGRRVCGALL